MLGCISHFKEKKFEIKKINTLVITLACWSFLSIFWADRPFKAFQTWAKITALISAGFLWWNYCNSLKSLQRTQLKKVVWVTAITLAALLILFGMDAQFGLISKLGCKRNLYHIIDQHISQALVHGCTACMLGIWMHSGQFNKYKWLQTGLIILLVPIMHYCTSDAASLGLILGISALAGYAFFPRFLKAVFIYGMPATWLSLPFVFLVFTTEYYSALARLMDASYTHRLFIWHSVALQTFKKFLTGFGFGSSRYRSLGCEQDIIVFDGTKDLILSAPENCLHPHNFMLQIWFELGAVGCILACLIWIAYWKKRYDNSANYTIAFWGSALGVAATGISIWQTWWIILLVILVPIYRLQEPTKTN